MLKLPVHPLNSVPLYLLSTFLPSLKLVRLWVSLLPSGQTPSWFALYSHTCALIPTVATRHLSAVYSSTSLLTSATCL
uniref:Uncharacterized protein n=1 Tax=Anguilla anguilla TaxID=7936 RepID=A0A0E9WLW8_ANGAN